MAHRSSPGSVRFNILTLLGSTNAFNPPFYWCRVASAFFPTSGNWSCSNTPPYFIDQPWLAVDAKAIYLSGYDDPGGDFDAFIINKDQLINHQNLVLTRFPSIGHSQQSGINYPRGATNYDPNATNGWLIGVDGGVRNNLVLIKVSFDINNVPSLGAPYFLDVGIYYAPDARVTQPPPTGGGTPIPIGNLLRKSLTETTIRNGQLWTSQTIGVNNSGKPDSMCEGPFSQSYCRDAMRWYEINVAGANPTLTKSDVIFSPDNYYIHGSVMVSGQGNAVFGMTTSGPMTNPGVAITTLLAGVSVPANYTFTFQNGAAPYYPSYDTSNPLRWGDYSFTSLDPCDDMTMWTIQEYVYDSVNWGVWAAKINAPMPIPNSISPYQIGAGALSVPVTLTGNGFFDSGALDACHQNLNVSVYGVNGPLAVSNVRYIDAGDITFNLSTCGASLSATVAVTNPDGQT